MIFNYYYLKQRWHEMAGQYAFATSIPLTDTATPQNLSKFSFSDYIQSKTIEYRIALFGSVLWVLVVLCYVFLFDPYGYMTDDDVFHMVKVILFPPSVVWFSLLIYLKLFKTQTSKQQ